MEKQPSKSSSGDDLALIGNVTRIWRHLTFQNSFIWQKCEICRRQQRGNFWLYPVRPKMHSSSERMGILQKPSKLLDEGLTLVKSLLWGGCIFLRCLLCVLHLSWYFCCVPWWWLWHFGAAISKTGSHPDDIDHLEIIKRSYFYNLDLIKRSYGSSGSRVAKTNPSGCWWSSRSNPLRFASNNFPSKTLKKLNRLSQRFKALWEKHHFKTF